MARRMKTAGLLVSAIVPFLTLGGPARADALQDQLRAAAQAAKSPPYAFKRTSAIDQTGQDKRTVVEAYDPRKATADQWSLLSINGRTPNAKELKEARKAKRDPVRGCQSFGDWIAAPATRIDSGQGAVTYRFASLPKGSFKVGSHDASADTQAEVLVNVAGPVPFVERIKLRSDKAFSMMLVASVKSLDMTFTCARMADGHVLLTGSTSTITGSMMGKSGQIRTSTTFGDLRRVL